MEEMQPSLWALILSIIVSLFIFSVAYSARFFTLPEDNFEKNPLKFYHLFIAFIIFFGTNFLLAETIYHFFMKYRPQIPWAGKFAYVHFISLSSVLLLYLCFFCLVKKGIPQYIFKRPLSKKSSIFFDCFMGILALIIVLPFTGLLNSIYEYTFSFFNIEKIPDQSAVSYFKKTLDYPLYFTLSIVFVSIYAPLTEEIFYRGFLQTYLKKYLGRGLAIFLSSIVFSLSHFSKDQKIANIPIFITLLIVGLMLGFVYERQKSLFSAITLHASFNTLNILNLLFFKDQQLF